MPIRHEPAICLRRYDFSETSQVVHLLAAGSGVLHLLAKGSKRPKGMFDGGLDLLDAGIASFSLGREGLSAGVGKGTFSESGPPLGLLTAWYQMDAHRGLHRSLTGQTAGMYAGELVTGLVTEHQPEPRVFAALNTLLAALDRLGLEPEEVYSGAHRDRILAEVLAFQVELLAVTGYTPLLDRCVGTQWPIADSETTWFSVSAGGVLSREAEAAYADKVKIGPQIRAALAGKSAPASAGRVAASLLAEHLEYVAEKPFKTFTRLRELLDF